jgi:hypothetical protein
MVLQVSAIVISIFSLFMAGLTVWLTLLRKGTIKMTQPAIIFFGRDPEGMSKVFLRTLLYSTSKRNHIVESMFVKVKRGESLQTFNLWVYGDTFLARGSGINVGPDGLVCNHHFLTPKDGTAYAFLPGGYTIEVYTSLVGRRSPLLLSTINLSLSDEHAAAMMNKDVGVFFDWGPNSQNFHAHLDERPQEKMEAI